MELEFCNYCPWLILEGVMCITHACPYHRGCKQTDTSSFHRNCAYTCWNLRFRGGCTDPMCNPFSQGVAWAHMQAPCNSPFRGSCTQPPCGLLSQGIACNLLSKRIVWNSHNPPFTGVTHNPMQHPFQKGLCATTMQPPFATVGQPSLQFLESLISHVKKVKVKELYIAYLSQKGDF